MKTFVLILVNLYVASIGLRAQNCEALLIAVQNNDYKQVQSLLQSVTPNCHFDGKLQPRTPLGMAALNGNLEIGKLLFQHKAKANYRFKRDASALMIAAQKGHYNFAKYLTNQGAKVNQKINGDGTPLMSAVKGGNKNITALFLKPVSYTHLTLPTILLV